MPKKISCIGISVGPGDDIVRLGIINKSKDNGAIK